MLNQAVNYVQYLYMAVNYVKYQFCWKKKKRTKGYPQNGANAPMAGANVPTELQNSENTKNPLKIH